jgi:predicted metal-dependent TIM-barrel fold hydrolase
MINKKNIIDSHVHLDMIERYHPDRIQWLKENGCSVFSWSYFEGVKSVAELEGCLQAKSQCMQKHSAAGLVCYYLVGVHPRSIPPDLKPEQVGSLLKPYLEDPLCRGVGEIGLETGDAREQEVFIAQLELGRNLINIEKIIGVHTPRSNKRPVTETTLEILSRLADLSSSLVVDHCTVETIGAVLNAGLWAGVTLSPAKTSWEDMGCIVSTCSDRIDRIMCNTDSGSDFYEDVVQFSRSDKLTETIRENLFYRNAARFFKIH